MKRLALLLALLVHATGCLAFHRGPMPGEPKKARYLEIDGTRVRYTDDGEGPPVVLIHGFASSLETWLTTSPALLGKHRVISLDLRGFGWTDRPENRAYDPASQGAMVWALLDELGVKETALVAHSWGSSVAMAMSLAQPQRVTRIALFDAFLFSDQLPPFFYWARADGLGEALFAAFYDQRPDERMAAVFFDPTRLSEQLAEEVEKAMQRPGTRAAALATVRGMHLEQQEGRYREVKVPMLLVWGREDGVTTLPFGERMQALTGAKLVVLPRCGHFPMLEQWQAANAELVAFLDGGAR